MSKVYLLILTLVNDFAPLILSPAHNSVLLVPHRYPPDYPYRASKYL